MIAGIIHEEPTLTGGLFCLLKSRATVEKAAARYNRFSPLPPTDASTDIFAIRLRRAAYLTVLLLIVNGVADGWPSYSTELRHQILLLPATAVFLWCLFQLLRRSSPSGGGRWSSSATLAMACLFEVAFTALYVYQGRHFASFGYRFRLIPAIALIATPISLLAFVTLRRASAALAFLAILFMSASDLLLSILSFPLNYLRSDMLPVIAWADRSLLLHTDPYTTLHVGNRLYDFPYLPGMMLAYYPAAALGVDPRFLSMVCLLGVAGLVFWAAQRDCRPWVVALLALFLLCPYLQYRHEMYLEPHWLTMVLVFVLMQRRHFAWAAVTLGVSMAIYQFSWILFPFFLLNGLRRRGWREVSKLAGLGVGGALVLVGPFLRSARHQIANNTVGQWGRLAAHANAEPMNLSFWVTYVIAPAHLLRLQAVLMVGIFLYCGARGRCADLTDTLRWMIIALTTFVMFNVLVDGYFYLMLLVPMLVFTCVANGWWAEPDCSIRARAEETA